MKTIKALSRWLKGRELSNKDRHRIDDFFISIKVGMLTLAIAAAAILLISYSGCMDGKITKEELQESRP